MKTSKYSSVIKNHEVRPKYFKNMLNAFFFGGLVCLFGEIVKWVYMNVFDLSNQDASTFMIVTLIIIGALTTGLGVYDKFGQHAKAAAFIPISGFANSLTSCAMEGKSEGLIVGIAGNMFKLAGTVIVIAVLSGFIFGILRYILVNFGIAPALDHNVVYMLEVFV